jgi:site-specific recombinase XerD
MKSLADLLGHRCLNSTNDYTQVDPQVLRSLAVLIMALSSSHARAARRELERRQLAIVSAGAILCLH